VTISAYHVNGVISAYNKQSKIKVNTPVSLAEPKAGKYEDVVSLSNSGSDKAQAYQKISYSIIDIILKKKEM